MDLDWTTVTHGLNQTASNATGAPHQASWWVAIGLGASFVAAVVIIVRGGVPSAPRAIPRARILARDSTASQVYCAIRHHGDYVERRELRRDLRQGLEMVGSPLRNVELERLAGDEEDRIVDAALDEQSHEVPLVDDPASPSLPRKRSQTPLEKVVENVTGKLTHL